ncbi:uncharacterized protein LAJ45_00796 [Morchella importuna]|nr:uncharacterized protein LAJ45_00796 [Morchella importuna]KAH8155784.1 hypothetical protein LAJ45_00796 [Morchella importuna]
MSPGSLYEMETEGHRHTSLWSRDVEAASRNLGNAVSSGGGGGGGVGGVMRQDSDDEGLGKISQAMTLLSLHRGQNDADSHGQSSTATTPRSANIPPSWPDPEELLKESLRQSLSALHALGRIKALSGRLPADEEVDTGGEIAQIMGIYDRAVGEMRAAGEVLDLAQQYLAREKEVVLEQLLKG